MLTAAAAFIFALALLCAGQTASITATLAGQLVSEGFIEWRVSVRALPPDAMTRDPFAHPCSSSFSRRQPFLRRIITRLIGLIPSVVVAIAVGRPGIDTLLVASQVALAIVLPFVAAPLIWLTSSKSVMSVRKPAPDEQASADSARSPTDSAADSPVDSAAASVLATAGSPPLPAPLPLPLPEVPSLPDGIEEVHLSAGHSLGSLDEKHIDEKQPVAVVQKHEPHRLHDSDEASSFDEEQYVSFASGWIVTSLAYLIFFVILAANMYAIVMLAMGRTT